MEVPIRRAERARDSAREGPLHSFGHRVSVSFPKLRPGLRSQQKNLVANVNNSSGTPGLASSANAASYFAALLILQFFCSLLLERYGMGGGMGSWPNGSGMGMGMPGGPSLSFPMPDHVSRGYSFEFQNLECTNSEISANCG